MRNADKADPDPLVDRLKALANTVSVAIIGALARHKPDPVPVRTLEAELGISESVASKHIRALRRVNLVRPAGARRTEGYLANTAELCAVIGLQSYRRITQDFEQRQNENAPGSS
jgi:predicted transcriptional regulator